MAAYLGDGDANVLISNEAEMYTESLACTKMEQVGGPKWQVQHSYIEKLNMQAVLNTLKETDDFVKECIISLNKVPVLIYDLIITELWASKVFPEILKLRIQPSATLQLYMTIFHEATVAGLLETILYHKESCEAGGENILDLVDYCHRKLTNLILRTECNIKHEEEKTSTDSSPEEELKQQQLTVSFTVAMKVISILRYITDHMTHLPLSVMTRLLNTHDIPHLLVQLIELSPWQQVNKAGEAQHFMDGHWKTVPDKDRLSICKLEGQVWLALYNVLLNPESQRKYEYTSHRKNQVLKLRKYLTEPLIDQISCLADMQQFLDHLTVMDPPTAKQDLILEQVPEILSALEAEYDGRWKDIAKEQLEEYFSPSQQQVKEHAQRLAATYNLDVLETLAEGPPKCALCGQTAAKRCSKCKNEWYCGRPCQVKHWSKHKTICDVVSSTNVV